MTFFTDRSVRNFIFTGELVFQLPELSLQLILVVARPYVN